MILDQLTVHDFGVYGGRQQIVLTPERDRPVILFGGLNGGGKTTLLDAFQLCLYGSAARLSNRNGHAYDDYLRRSIHKSAPRTAASVELGFRHRTNGAEQSFTLVRSWAATKSGVREQFEVARDGQFDRLATEHWATQVEDFIPARIAHLFLFDGEKVEGYADLEAAPALVATAIQNLLGLDIVERLAMDLASIERRHRTASKTPDEQIQLEDLQTEIRSVDAARLFLAQARAAAGNALDRARRENAEVEERYRREGGTLYEQRASKEAELAARLRQLDLSRRALQEVAGGIAPLLLVSRLLSDVNRRDEQEEAARRARETLDVLAREHKAMLAHPVVAALPQSAQALLAGDLEGRRRERESATNHPIVLGLDTAARMELLAVCANQEATRAELLRLLEEEREVVRMVEELKAEVAAIPSHDAIAGLEAERVTTQTALQAAEAEFKQKSEELAKIEGELASLRQREERLVEAEAKARFAQEDVVRMLRHSERVRSTLGRFRDAVVVRHVERIQALVLDSFRQLARKTNLVGDLRIDPVTFRLDLRDGDQRALSAERLSAGERQLLAIAILWGLARAADRPLPTVIDTPLGRLDSEHRDHLVRRYFPRASHQVLLLSTDEEITGRHYKALRPAIGREYRLRFDEAEERTVIEPGYFAEAGHGH
ncbi:MAG TPA: DNA sulfur modification protein DndD [Acidiphilium sp.]|nr:DNA sulfur modification protein DndD [Acidiphilium sp.]